MPTTTSAVRQTAVYYEWTSDITHTDGEVLTCKATARTTDGPPAIVFATSYARWRAGVGVWELLMAMAPLEGTWPIPPSNVKPRSSHVGGNTPEPCENTFQVDNMEGHVQIGELMVNTRGDHEHPNPVRGYVMLGKDPQLILSLIAHLVTASNLDLENDVRPAVGAILNARK